MARAGVNASHIIQAPHSSNGAKLTSPKMLAMVSPLILWTW
mgnify:CR=1 FL=1